MILFTAPIEQLRSIHRALRIATPLEQASPTMLATLTVIAHCWRDRIPANLWPDDEAGPTHPVDLKRRAAGDFD